MLPKQQGGFFYVVILDLIHFIHDLNKKTLMPAISSIVFVIIDSPVEVLTNF